MATIALNNVIAGTAGTILQNAGAPSAGTTQVDTLTIGGAPTAGAGSTFTLAFDGYTTAPILWNATNTTLVTNIDTALEALPNTSNGAGGAFTTAVGTMTAGVGTITITYTGNLANKLYATGITAGANNMTGAAPTLAVATTTPGVTATFRHQGEGTIVEDTTSGIAYSNTGTALVPVWTKIGLQS